MVRNPIVLILRHTLWAWLGVSSAFVEASGQDVRFVDATDSAGVAFQHVNGASGRYYYVETIGSGACFFDYDNDGWIDLYVVNGRLLPGSRPGETPRNHLYHNNGDGTFTDVTERAGVGGGDGYGMGCVAADYDNDGYQDLFVTNFGTSVLFHNEGDGTFRDVTASAGVGGSGWQTGCAFGDYDNDGDLDLFVVRYVSYTLSESSKKLIPYTTEQTRYNSDAPAYPAPMNFEGSSCILYRNEGNGTFTDVTRTAGVYNPEGKGLGVLFSDLDGDSLLDILVANDRERNFLYRNRGDGTFEDVARQSGIAYDGEGMARAGMGVDGGDYVGDGRLSIVMTNFRYDGLILFRNDGPLSFTDVSLSAGIREPSLPYVGWGVALFDYDNDGRPDLFVANGHVLDNADAFDPASEYAQPNLLLHNEGSAMGHAVFRDASGSSGPGLQIKKVSRGAAFGDYDNDGDVDVFVVNNNQRADLLRNDGGNRNHWLRVKLVGGMRGQGSGVRGQEKQDRGMRNEDRGKGGPDPQSPIPDPRLSNRDGIGAVVTVVSEGRRQVQEVRAGSSYLSCNDRRLHFGLGKSSRVDLIEVRWPSGVRTQVQDVSADQQVIIEEGKGMVR